MERTSQLARIAGAALVAGGVGHVVAGALHPSAKVDTLREGTITILRDPGWAVPHWFALVGMLALAWGAWLLVDAGVGHHSSLAQAGGRLAILASLFMGVQAAVELSAPVVVETYAAGEPAPIVELIEAMQTVGWPGFALGWALLAVGCGARLAPRPVVAAMVAGSAAFAIAGVLVEGFGVMEAAPLFAAGGLQAIWILWAGVRLVSGRTRTEDAPAGASVMAASVVAR